MVKSNTLYKHDMALDTAIDVLTCFEGSTHYKLKVRWVNLGFVQSYLIFGSNTHNIEVAKTDFHNWMPVIRQRTTMSYYKEA